MTERLDPLTEQPDRPTASRPVGVALVGAALFAAVVVPGIPAGLGTSLTALLTAGAVAAARPAELDRVSKLFLGLMLILLAVPVLRSAEWLVALDLIAAAGLGALVVTRAATWRGILGAPFAVLRKVGRAPRFTVQPLLPRPGLRQRLRPALRGAALGALLVLVFGSLFASADRAFAEIAGDLLVPNVDLSLVPARILVFGSLLLGTGALVLAGRRYAASTGGGDAVALQARRGMSGGEWMIALGLLDLLFAGFVAVQVAVFFGGSEQVLETTGLTFAEYARQGFFQLLAVGGLTLGVIAATVRWARRDSSRDRRIIQVLLGALIVLTLVVLASAFMRLTLYESVFGYTRLRISVHAVILWMGLVFLALLVAGVRMRAAWLPRAVVAVTAFGLVAFSLMDPDHLIASRNVDRYLETGRIDLHYLSGLSPDAVPALVRLPPRLARCALSNHAHLGPAEGAIDFTEKGLSVPGGGYGAEAGREARSLFAWNYGRARAMEVMPPRQPAAATIACIGAQRMGLW